MADSHTLFLVQKPATPELALRSTRNSEGDHSALRAMQGASHGSTNRASLPRVTQPRRSRSVHPFERLTTYTTVSTFAGEYNEFERQHAWMRHLPPVDINHAIPSSWVRCIMSIASFMLLVTDIPRSGLGIKTTSELYPRQTAPDMSLFFDPEPYSVAHITCQPFDSSITGSNSLNCSGWEGSEPIEQTSAWSYGYDTTSIGMRAFAELFSPPNFPDFLLERGTDPRIRDSTASIELDTVFRMLDGFVAVAQQTIDSERSKTTLRRLWFASQYHWIDRLHQYLMRRNLQNLRWRLHSIHSRSSPPGSGPGSEELWRPVCASPSAVGQRGTAFATYAECEHFVRWRCQHPLNSSLGTVSIAEHLPTRLHMLQQKYPDLWMDTVVVAAQETMSTSSLLSHAILHSLDTSEVVVLTRGKNCSPTRTVTQSDSTPAECTTVFVDDYRYERNMVTSNVPDWYFVTATLRGTAQVYVWLRLVLLMYISYSAQPRRLRSLRQRASSALVSIFKIPFQVVVYGSIIPNILYVCAFFIDIYLIESKLDSLWTTARGGYSNVDKLAFIRACTMQMRNMWLLALLAKLPVLLQTRDSCWRPHMGIRGVRGLAIGFASMLSIFGPYRSLSFRSSANVSVILLGRQYDAGRFGGLKNEQGMAPNQLPLPIGPSLMMTVLAIVVMLALDGVLRLASWVFHRDWRGHEILFGSSILVPHSAGRLWPITALAIRFNLGSTTPFAGGRHRLALTSPIGRSSSVSPARTRCPKEPTPPTPPPRDTHRRMETQRDTGDLTQQADSTNVDRRRSIDVCNRSDGVRAVVQLMNVTMMSDPWTLFQLRAIGVKLFVYRVYADDASADDANADGGETSLAILPYAPNEVCEWTGLTKGQVQLVDIVDSSDVPLTMLLQSG
jgi:hypothetical protein